MARLVLKRGADVRIRAGHPWIYRGEIADLSGRWTAGVAVDIVDAVGRFLGRGFYNPGPSLACRILTRRAEEPVDGAFFLRRLRAALATGATGALLLESSGEALEGARRNLELNGLTDRAELRPDLSLIHI